MIVLATAILAISAATASASPFSLPAVVIESPPAIDGGVDSTEWAGAALATGFIQYEPRRGEAASVKTDALIAYDADHLYVAFRAWDAQPLTAQLTRRDADLMADDSVLFLLDSNLDRQSAYYFGINPLGTQLDGRIVNNGRTVDDTWDCAWRSAARQEDWGWSAELAIPFTSIKFVAGEDRTWGVNFGRSRRRTWERGFWAGPLDDLARVSQAGTLEGLQVSEPEQRHHIIPYGIARLQEGEAAEWDIGVDLSYAVTPQTSIYGTINPDFATIEADQEEVNLTRFELSLPEKRPFFLEGNELFGQRIRTFYSRRIVDIGAGAKLLGREGPWTFVLLSAASGNAVATPDALYTVARVQRGILGSSNIAVTLADRSLDGEHRGSVGADATLFFTETWGATTQFVRSYGHHSRGTTAFFVRPAYDSPTGHFHVRYTHLGEHFRENANGIGFIRDDDRRELDAAVEKGVWPQASPVERLSYDSNYNVFWSQAGVLRSWEIREELEIDFRNRWGVEIGHEEGFERFEKDFRNRETSIEIGYNTRAFQSVELGYEFGRSFDADFRLWSAEAAYKVTPRVDVEYELQRLDLDPDPDGENTWIHVVRSNAFITRDLFLRFFFQTNSAIHRRNVQAVFVYRYRPPFGSFQIAFQRGSADLGQRSEQGNTLFLKLTGTF